MLLKSYKPKPRLLNALLFFWIFGGIFLALGITYLIYSLDINEEYFRYDDITECKVGGSCGVSLELKETLEAPIYVYYKIHGFY